MSKHKKWLFLVLVLVLGFIGSVGATLERATAADSCYSTCKGQYKQCAVAITNSDGNASVLIDRYCKSKYSTCVTQCNLGCSFTSEPACVASCMKTRQPPFNSCELCDIACGGW